MKYFKIEPMIVDTSSGNTYSVPEAVNLLDAYTQQHIAAMNFRKNVMLASDELAQPPLKALLKEAMEQLDAAWDKADDQVDNYKGE